MVADGASAEVEVRGHIIDSLILPKILDAVTAAGGTFQIQAITIGPSREDPSYARLVVRAPTEDRLREILDVIHDHGAVAVDQHDCRLVAADFPGAYPEGFYSTTNQRTEVRVAGRWIPVAYQEMDCGICVDQRGRRAWCVPMCDVEPGQRFVVGHRGVRVFPEERPGRSGSFEFMNSAVSTEKPKAVAIREVAAKMHAARASEGKILVVAGPAVVHTGSGPVLCELIRRGYVDILFAGNALAAHDVERAFFGTSLGVHLDRGEIVESGHEHHLRAINRIRRAGGLAEAVQRGDLREGIIYECVRQNVDIVLAGSIRDDGPLPEVITDVLAAQRAMRRRIPDVAFCLMLATTLHSIAVGNLLPAWVDVVCVDINPSTVIKLSDRGSFQTIGIVTDVAPFLTMLASELAKLDEASAQASPERPSPQAS